METALAIAADQWPMAVFLFGVIAWVLTRSDKLSKAAEERQDKLQKADDERREKERAFQCMEAEKQRLWHEDQGKKRDLFQRELINHTNMFIKGLQEDQKKSINLLNESIQLVSSKTDLVLQTINQHHTFAEKSVSEISKWRNGVTIRKKENAE